MSFLKTIQRSLLANAIGADNEVVTGNLSTFARRPRFFWDWPAPFIGQKTG